VDCQQRRGQVLVSGDEQPSAATGAFERHSSPSWDGLKGFILWMPSNAAFPLRKPQSKTWHCPPLWRHSLNFCGIGKIRKNVGKDLQADLSGQRMDTEAETSPSGPFGEFFLRGGPRGKFWAKVPSQSLQAGDAVEEVIPVFFAFPPAVGAKSFFTRQMRLKALNRSSEKHQNAR